MKLEEKELLNLFIEPDSVALIGVSRRTGPESYNILEHMLGAGYKGQVYPVNPAGGELLGKKIYRSVKDLPETPDLAIISTPRRVVLDVIGDCVERGIKAVVIVTQGFADADAAGREMQEKLEKTARDAGMRIVGPNTLGISNLFAGFNTAFLTFDRLRNGVGVICQSGIFLAASADFSTGMGVGVDIGNAADLGFNELLDYLGRDDRIKVINLHMEGVRGGRQFMETAGRVSRKKPILCLKTGCSEEGARAAASHSGSLAGEDHVFEAAFRQSGVIRLRDVEDMHYLNKTFLTYPGIKGRRVGVITISGGAGIAAVDALSNYGLEVANFSPRTQELLNKVSPDWMKVDNPADIWPAGMSRGYSKIIALALDAVLSDPQVDACLCVTPAYRRLERGKDNLERGKDNLERGKDNLEHGKDNLEHGKDPLDVTKIIAETAARYPEKPTAVWVFGSGREDYVHILEKTKRVVVYPSPERAARSLAVLNHYYNNIKVRPAYKPVIPEIEGVHLEKAGHIVRRAAALGSSTVPAAFNEENDRFRISRRAALNGSTVPVVLNEEMLDVLEAYGIPVVERGTAAGKKEALAAAEKIGYPVVMKIASPQITHKSDAGGVKLNIRNKVELITAYDEMMKKVAGRVCTVDIKGVHIQAYRPEGTEVILGCRRDNEFGPVLVFGLGGIYTELFRDAAFRIAPIDKEDALSMVRETKSYRLLQGYRGKPPADLDALVDCLLRLSRLVCDHVEIQELDINPLMVTVDGVLAVDARASVVQSNAN